MSEFNWQDERARWHQRDHPTQRRGTEWYHEEYDYRIQKRGHRASSQWQVVFDKHGEFVLTDNGERFWYNDIYDVMFTLSKREFDSWPRLVTITDGEIEDVLGGSNMLQQWINDYAETMRNRQEYEWNEGGHWE